MAELFVVNLHFSFTFLSCRCLYSSYLNVKLATFQMEEHVFKMSLIIEGATEIFLKLFTFMKSIYNKTLV
jgi:hypothetical protein